jgi:hypothetical protein
MGCPSYGSAHIWTPHKWPHVTKCHSALDYDEWTWPRKCVIDQLGNGAFEHAALPVLR